MSIVLMFGVVGLVVDFGLAYAMRHSAQTAADAAAVSAATWAMANGYSCGSGGVICTSAYTCANPPVSPATDQLQVGCLYADSNGFRTGGHSGKQTVVMSAGTGTPPGTSGNTPTLWIQALISDSNPPLFGSALGFAGLSTSASSTAAVNTTPPSSCIYALDPSASGAVSAGGSVTVTASCGIYVNSSNTSALSVSGGAHVTASQILVNGHAYVSNNSVVSPSPTPNAGSITDPLASLPMKTTEDCTYTNYSIPNQGSVTLSPGTYCGGLSINGQVQVTFQPGTYILNGGGMNVSGGATLTGSSVTFFNTGQNGRTISSINLSGNTTFSVSAPSSGTYEGMLFVQDRNSPDPGPSTFSGTSGSIMQGTLYFPHSTVKYTGTSSSSGTHSAIVANAVTFSGNTDFLNDPTGVYTGLAVKSSTLIQ